MTGNSKKNRENYPRECFDKKIGKPRLKFNPGLALTSIQTTGPRALSFFSTLFDTPVDQCSVSVMPWKWNLSSSASINCKASSCVGDTTVQLDQPFLTRCRVKVVLSIMKGCVESELLSSPVFPKYVILDQESLKRLQKLEGKVVRLSEITHGKLH